MREAGKPRRGLCHAVASVYVEASLRGKGYANALLERMHAQLQKEGALACYLMSEIGPTRSNSVRVVAIGRKNAR